MSRDIPPYGLRMPVELKELLTREAKINGRSLNSEIVERLKKSLEESPPATQNSYTKKQLNDAPDSTQGITDIERQLLTIFRRLEPTRQLALLSLFK